MTLLSLGLLLAMTTTRVEDSTVRGTIERAGPRAVLRWAVVIDEAAPVVAARLLDTANAAALTSGERSIAVARRDAPGVILHLVREAPFFLPEVWVDLRVGSTVTPDGGAVITWTRIAGSVAEYRRA
jgi:hypothetical protein